MAARGERRRSKCRAEIYQRIACPRSGFALRLDHDHHNRIRLCPQNAPRCLEVMYTPLDYWPIMRRAFSVIRPARIVLVEAEVWPNLAAKAHARRIPLALVNARLSPHSERRYRQFRFFIAPTFQLLDLVCVPEKEDAERWAALGVSRHRIRVTGSIKYDPDVQKERQAVAAS